jgi:hypothetical protein
VRTESVHANTDLLCVELDELTDTVRRQCRIESTAESKLKIPSESMRKSREQVAA